MNIIVLINLSATKLPSGWWPYNAEKAVMCGYDTDI